SFVRALAVVGAWLHRLLAARRLLFLSGKRRSRSLLLGVCHAAEAAHGGERPHGSDVADPDGQPSFRGAANDEQTVPVFRSCSHLPIGNELLDYLRQT